MNAIQLEFNLYPEDQDPKLHHMQLQIDAACESMGKVRRKLFSELGELKKALFALQQENQALREKLQKLSNEKTDWNYSNDDSLFSVKN